MPMVVVWILVALAVLLAGISLWRRHQAATRAAAQRRHTEELDTLTSWEPQPTRVLRPGEQTAMLVLARALPDYIVLAQVPLARFIRVPQRNSYTEWLRRVGQLSPDLIVCDMTSQVIAAVEVGRADGKLSERGARRLDRMSRVLKAANVPLHTWTESRLPSPEEARQAIVPKSAAEAAKPARTAPVATPMRLSEFDDAVSSRPPPAPRRPPVIVDVVEDAVVLREPPPSSWFEDDFDPDSELPESTQSSTRQFLR